MSILTMFKKKVHKKEEIKETQAEVWKPLSYCEKYSVSNLGRVRNNETNSYLAIDHSGVRPRIKINQKNKLLCNLVAETFIDNPNNYCGVININGDVNDNRVENLRWCVQRHVHCKGKVTPNLNEDSLKKEFIWNNVKIVKRLAKKYKINTEQVLKIVNK